MCTALGLLVFVCAVGIVKAQWDFDRSFPRRQSLGDDCTTDNGESGSCQPIRRCPEIGRNHWPTYCRYQGRNPLVCCPASGSLEEGGSKSRRKCEDYYPKKIRNRYEWFGPSAHGLIGGVKVSPREFPHMAALGYGDSKDPTWACGGSLISEKFVLSAAHCVESQQLGKVQVVRLGDLNIKVDTDDAQPQNINVLKRIKHPDYKHSNRYHDIALIELEKKVIINEYVRPACLQTSFDIPNPDWTATGWGNLEFGGKSADHLHKIDLQEISNEECKDIYRTDRRLVDGIVERSQICAWEDQKDTCQGDSGGPLQYKNTEFTSGYTVIGVTSFGKACGISNSPGVYTRVSNYINWIESIIWVN